MASYLGNSPDTILQVRKRNFRYVATSNQTVFSGSDSNSLTMSVNTADVEVFLNGVLLDQTDYTITASQLTLVSGAATDDIIEVITNTTFNSADQYTKEEIDTKVSSAITNLKGGVGTALDTLNELSDALGDDANFAATVTTALAAKADTSSLASVATSGSYADLTNKPTISATAISDQSNISTGYFDLPAGTTAQRPGSPNSGNFRYNTEVGAPEYYNGTTWLSLGTLDGSTENRAAPSALYLKNTVGLTTSGVYWIKAANMTQAVQVYCDLSYDSGGYMLLAYGYVANTNDSSSNKAIPNLNHDGTRWSYAPTSRASSNGLVASPNSQKSALLLAKLSTNMIMAAGSNPSTGGIDGYSYVYRFAIPDPSALTFNNHSYYYNSSMTNVAVTVTGLKGDTGTWSRYTIKEAIGASWGDSYPTGYGCVESSTLKNSTWDYGPFFPSIHSGSRNIAPTNPTVVTSSPDIGVNGYTAGAESYTYRGWYGAGIGVNQTGQTSIWVK